MEKKRQSSMLEFLRPSKIMRKTSNNNASPSNQTIDSSKTSNQGSISKDKDSGKYCPWFSKDKSEKLFLNTETDFVDLDSISWNGSSSVTASPSQWKIKWIPHSKILQKTLPFSVRNTMESENITKRTVPEAMMMKVKMKPTKEQKEILKQWIGTSRLMYNRALDLVRKGEKINFQSLRNQLALNHTIKKGEEWLKKVPKCVKEGGVRQLIFAFKTNFAKQNKNNSNSPFKIHFRSKKKCLTEVMEFCKRGQSFAKGNKDNEVKFHLQPRKIKEPIRIIDSKKTISKLLAMKTPPCDFKVQYRYKTKEWYLLIPYPFGIKKKKKPSHEVVALDPGVRTFLTAYSPTAGIGKLLQGGLEKTKSMLGRIDSIASVMSKIKANGFDDKHGKNSIRNRKRLIHKLWKKIKNTRLHMHYTTCNFLLDNFKHILLPKFETSKMVKKENRSIGTKTAKDMLTWGHYEFQQRLIWKSQRRGYINNIWIVSEAHTTITCGRCGIMNYNVGGNEIFCCNKCNLVIDRDINAARNILMRNMGFCGDSLEK